ncbi:MAG: trypsin-like peptidase domain-containing protein [Candidatus Andersenbacteria bacterium]
MSQNNLQQLGLSFVAGILGALVVLLIAARNPELVPGFPDLSLTSQRSSLTAPGSVPALSGDEFAIVDTVKAANPAVVSIVITKDVPVIERYFEDQPFSNPFNDFFGDGFFSPFQFRVPSLRQQGTEKREIGGGSGFLISADGMVITNRHVVADTTAEYTVFTNDGEKHTATIVARDPANDIAILKIEGGDYPFLQFGDSDALQVGQTAIAIGNALSEFRNTVSVGVISGLSRSIIAGDASGQSEQLEQVIQTDAAINPGNSGGPLLNLAGQVVGVNVAVALGSENIGFALPANTVKAAVDSVQRTGRIVRPFLGVRYTQITPILQEREQLSVDYGVLVTPGETTNEPAVIPGSPADKVGIRAGDIILEADGRRLDDTTSLSALIRQKEVGETVQLKVLSQGTQKDVTVTLEENSQ